MCFGGQARLRNDGAFLLTPSFAATGSILDVGDASDEDGVFRRVRHGEAPIERTQAALVERSGESPAKRQRTGSDTSVLRNVEGVEALQIRGDPAVTLATAQLVSLISRA